MDDPGWTNQDDCRNEDRPDSYRQIGAVALVRQREVVSTFLDACLMVGEDLCDGKSISLDRYAERSCEVDLPLHDGGVDTCRRGIEEAFVHAGASLWLVFGWTRACCFLQI